MDRVFTEDSGAASPDAPRVPEPALCATSTRPPGAWPRLVEAAGGEDGRGDNTVPRRSSRHPTPDPDQRSSGHHAAEPVLQCNSEIMQKEESLKKSYKKITERVKLNNNRKFIKLFLIL